MADTFNNGESALSVRTKINAMANEVNSLGVQVSSAQFQTGSLSIEVGSLTTQVGSLATQVGSISTQVGSISANVSSNNAAITSLQAGGGGGTSWTFTDSQSGLSASGDIVLFDTTSATPTKNFPTAPSDGDEVWFVDDTGSAGTNNITLIASDTLVMGVNSSFTINIDYANPRFKYLQTNSDWRLVMR